jgi:hypothetical protein
MNYSILPAGDPSGLWEDVYNFRHELLIISNSIFELGKG